MLHKDLHEDNRRAWNEATAVHNSHKHDQAAFLRSGGTTLFPEELALLGDIAGAALVHLQCNAGQDSLSLAKLGAEVTGVDISDTAIDFAEQLSHDSGIPATFERMDVYDWLEQTARGERRFDVVFSSYGALCWLSDIETWARGIAAILRPGGRFVIVEFHPFAMTFDEQWKHAAPYFAEGRTISYDSGIGDYVKMSGPPLAPSGYLDGVQDFVNPHPGHEWPWGIGELLTAFLEAGMQITAFEEYPYENGCKQFKRMREMPGHRMYPPEDVPSLPLMFGLAARKPS